MKKMQWLVLIAFCFFQVSSLAGSASNTHLINAGGLYLLMPIPDDFVNVKQELPSAWAAYHKVKVGNTELAAIFAGMGNVKALREGRTQKLTSYITVRYPLENQGGRVSQQSFDQLRLGMRPIVRRPSVTLSDARLKESLVALSNSFSADPNARSKLLIDQPAHVSIDADTKDRFIYTQLTTVQSKTATDTLVMPMVTTSALIFVQGKVLQVNYVNEVSNPGIVEVNRRTLMELTSQTMKLN